MYELRGRCNTLNKPYGKITTTTAAATTTTTTTTTTTITTTTTTTTTKTRFRSQLLLWPLTCHLSIAIQSP